MNNGVKDLRLGIPTYDGKFPGHLPWVETTATAIHGLKLGLAGLKPEERARVGAAIYAEWTTSESEEETYLRQWIGQ